MINQEITRAYSIQEVSKLLGIPSGTIRQWEKDLSGLLIIPRTKQGARYYTNVEIKLLEKIQAMRAQNVGKGMIRTLLEKHLQSPSEPASESFEMVLSSTDVEEAETQNEHLQQLTDIQASLQSIKEGVIHEVRREMIEQRSILLDEIKHELANSSIQTVVDISKSIQRSNDKRKADMQVLTEAIQSNSKYTSETFGTLSETIAKHSKVTSESIEQKIEQMNQAVQSENDQLLSVVSQTVADVKNDVRTVAFSLHEDQQQLRESIHELQEFTSHIHQREEGFQDLVSAFREAAAAKTTKKRSWWRLWAD
ncbi:MerR family transcriptional regulator [Robertmurraya korlensis]|uniref:MerR family transcriptional regulator n=1 Tax=Robertmurraya korlensis TaxID=519977 RepID=UPI00082506C0|nr:MerR family transcriptional regulator [Robertmurraya korlensis]